MFVIVSCYTPLKLQNEKRKDQFGNIKNKLLMAVIVNLDVMMAKRKIKVKDLADQIGITDSNLSKLKTGRAKAIRFTTLSKICLALDCQPSDILEVVPDEPGEEEETSFEE